MKNVIISKEILKTIMSEIKKDTGAVTYFTHNTEVIELVLSTDNRELKLITYEDEESYKNTIQSNEKDRDFFMPLEKLILTIRKGDDLDKIIEKLEDFTYNVHETVPEGVITIEDQIDFLRNITEELEKKDVGDKDHIHLIYNLETGKLDYSGVVNNGSVRRSYTKYIELLKRPIPVEKLIAIKDKPYHGLPFVSEISYTEELCFNLEDFDPSLYEYLK